MNVILAKALARTPAVRDHLSIFPFYYPDMKIITMSVFREFSLRERISFPFFKSQRTICHQGADNETLTNKKKKHGIMHTHRRTEHVAGDYLNIVHARWRCFPPTTVTLH